MGVRDGNGRPMAVELVSEAYKSCKPSTSDTIMHSTNPSVLRSIITEILALSNLGTGIFKLDGIESIWVRTPYSMYEKLQG